MLLNFVQEPYFTEETVQKEQGIIGQEIQMYEDHPQWKIFKNLLGALYSEHPVRRDIAGSRESIALITPDLLYHLPHLLSSSNMAVFVVGDVDPKKWRCRSRPILAAVLTNRCKIQRFLSFEPEEQSTPGKCGTDGF